MCNLFDVAEVSGVACVIVSYAAPVIGERNDTIVGRRGNVEWERPFFVRKGDE